MVAVGGSDTTDGVFSAERSLTWSGRAPSPLEGGGCLVCPGERETVLLSEERSLSGFLVVDWIQGEGEREGGREH